MSEEIWKQIPGYEGSYDASTHGRIRTAEGKISYTERHGARHWQSRIMKGRGDNAVTGKRVGLWLNGKCKDWLVARLIAITFLGDPPEKFTVNHKDGNRMNNNIENLEWLSVGDNIRHAFDTGLMPYKRVCLIDQNDEAVVFRSMAKAGEHIGRNNGYISLCLKRGCVAKDINDHEYKIVLIDQR